MMIFFLVGVVFFGSYVNVVSLVFSLVFWVLWELCCLDFFRGVCV